ncbi:hypothetical protein [Achromobacter sp. AONIH1]|uniref:hypothetical protein n=1 Tax=Achromobacter sp. AONIH1 TaxID=1758194 RepID=UPI000CD2AAC6|nr:hypothetical protein [Achromobacter sp. AONIH1]AUT46569.1 hypothetical protein C2U31_11580 [Achromobacter sp. AONIH1]
MRQILPYALLLGILLVVLYAVYDLYRIYRHKKKRPDTPYIPNQKIYNYIAVFLVICGVIALYLRHS